MNKEIQKRLQEAEAITGWPGWKPKAVKALKKTLAMYARTSIGIVAIKCPLCAKFWNKYNSECSKACPWIVFTGYPCCSSFNVQQDLSWEALRSVLANLPLIDKYLQERATSVAKARILQINQWIAEIEKGQ